MKLLQTIKMIAPLVLIFSIAGCQRNQPSPVSSKNEVNPEAKIKEKTVNELRTMAEPLALVSNIDSHLGEGNPFVYPVSLSISEKSSGYISDNNAHQILYYDPDLHEIAPLSAPEQEKLNWPSKIKIANETIFVSDNQGIKILSKKGIYQSLLRVYYQITKYMTKVE